MTKHIFLVPVDTKHFNDTITNGKKFSEVFPYLPDVEKPHIPYAKPLTYCYWGTLPGPINKQKYAEMAPGDEILFYRHFKYIAGGVVGFTTINPDLGRHTWGIDKRSGNTWELVYFLSRVYPLAVDATRIAKLFDLKQTMLRGFTVVEDAIAQPFLQQHGSVATFLDKKFAKSAM